MDSTAIFLFTRNRPNLLKITLDSLKQCQREIYIVDDSDERENCIRTREYCLISPKYHYLGKVEFEKFISLIKINLPNYSFLLRSVGSLEWNLGYARNFALLFAKYNKLDSVLFMDDDITNTNPKLISILFKKLSKHNFTGANIRGLADDSILGHLATDLGITNERTLSGGFMAFNLKEVTHFFLNNYNEDWIWLYLHLKNKKPLQLGSVFQYEADPFYDYEKKILFQEFGEIALDGVLALIKERSFSQLSEPNFWKQIVQQRYEYLSMLQEKSLQKKSQVFNDILIHLKNNLYQFQPNAFYELFRDYFINRQKFLNLLNSL